MKILLLNDRIPPENQGGAGEVVWRLARRLHLEGHEVHVAAATPGPAFQAVREGIPTYHLHSRYPERLRAYLSLYNPQTAGPLRDLYARLRPDVIHAHNIHADLGYYSLTLAHRMRLPAVFTSHDVMPFAYQKLRHYIQPGRCDVPPAAYRLPLGYNLRQMRLRYNPLRNLLIRRILARHVQVRTAPSQALCDAHAANGLPPFTVVYNGLDADSFRATPERCAALRDHLGLAGRRVLLFAGRLTEAKGTRPLLHALRRVVQHVPQALLLVLSAQPITPTDLADFDDLAGHIRSGGWLQGDALAAAFHLADVVVVPSIIFDTFPTVNLEAMAAARPVVATCYGGSREVVQDGVTGSIVNPFDTDQLAARLVALLTDAALRQRMGAAGLARLHARFTMQHQAAALLAHYQHAQQFMFH